jgi:4-amino-4-deoxy-L-arabinose transferase-like glycosyltransferase
VPSLAPNNGSLNPFLLMGPALLAAFLFSWSIFHSDLSKREAREGVPVVNMMRGGNIWLPQINPQQLRTKPPLFYWSGLLTSKLFGEVSEITLRIPSVLAGVGTVFLTTFLGMRQFSATIGCLAGLIIATCWRFAYLGSHARIDMLFTFFITLAFVALWELSRDEKKSLKWLAGLAIGLAVLTKGPLGWLFPLLAIFIFSRLHKTFSVPWAYLLALPLAMAGLWLGVGLMAGGEEFSQMIYQETVGRVSGSEAIHIHPKPFYYYIPQIFGGMAPWSLFLPFALWHGKKYQDVPWKFCLIALATLFIFLSLFPGKRGDYLLPLYPMGAVMLAVFFSRAEGGLSFPTRIVMGLMMLLALVLAFGALLPELNFESLSLNSRDRWMAQLLYDEHRPSTLLLAIGTVGMLAFCYALVLNKNSGMKISGIIAGWAFLLYLGVHGPAAKIVNEHTSFRPFAEELKQISENRPLFNYGKAREDLLYYLDSPITETYDDPTSQQPNALLLIKKSQSQAWLQKHSDQKVLLEMNAAFEPYQLIGLNIPPRR